ncbi:uncharacterized protein LOC135111780 [Scylla paramamosain]|uniref:uncharacterized protein LOC135111780 n=1 Tax=Scylla paramamosain TaxID=85552 RepID=UPI003083C55E
MGRHEAPRASRNKARRDRSLCSTTKLGCDYSRKDQSTTIQMQENAKPAKAAFRACDLVPFNPKKVLAKVDRTSPEASSTLHVSNFVLQKIQTLHKAALTSRGRGVRSKMVMVQPGVSVTETDMEPSTSTQQTPATSVRQGTGKKAVTSRKPLYTESDMDTSEDDSNEESDAVCGTAVLRKPKRLKGKLVFKKKFDGQIMH